MATDVDPSSSDGNDGSSEYHEKPVPLTSDSHNSNGGDLEANLRQRQGSINTKEGGDEEEEDEEEEEEVKERWYRTVWTIVRPGYIIDHLDFKSFKVVSRTIIVLWVGVLLTVIDSTRTWLGQAPYLMYILSFIMASGGRPIILSHISTFLCLVLLCYGWTYHIISNAITTRLRGYPTAQEITMQLIDEGVCQNNSELQRCVTDQIFGGRYLETKCTVIYIFAMLIGLISIYMFRRQSLLFITPSIVGIITICVVCTFGVHFPFYAFTTMGFVMLKPFGLVFGLDIVTSALVFPFTASSAFFGGATGCLNQLVKVAEDNIKFLETVRPSSSEFAGYKQIGQRALDVLGKLAPLDLMASLSSLEIAYGRLDSGDAGEMRSLMKNLVNSIGAFGNFYTGISDRKDIILDEIKPFSTIRRSSTVAMIGREKARQSKLYKKLHKVYKPVGQYESKRRLDYLAQQADERFMEFGDTSASVPGGMTGGANHPSTGPVDDRLTLGDLDAFMDLGYKRCSPALQASIRLMKAVSEWLAAANAYRTYSIVWQRKKHAAKQKECYENVLKLRKELQDEVDILQNSRWEEFLKWHAQHDWIGVRSEHMVELVGNGALLGFVTTSHCEITLRMAHVCLSLDKHVPKPRWIMPWRKTHRTRARMNRTILAVGTSTTVAGVGSEAVPDDIPAFQPYDTTQKRDPDASPPRNVGHLIGKKFVRFYDLLLNKHFQFCIRSAVFTVIAAFPAFFRTTSLWFYGNRLIWVVVMTAISTAEFTGDTVYTFVGKIVYTFLGCLVGMVGWYISTGNGNGNDYGYAIVFFVIGVYLAFYRHFSIHATPMPSIVFCVSVSLVLGTSWVDEQTNVLSYTGSGFKVAWVRFVSVIVGLSLGFLASVLPRPQTGKRAIRIILCKTLQLIGNLHCDVGKFALKRMDDPSVHILERDDVLMHRFRAVLAKLVSIQPLLKSLRFEPNLTGPWPKQKYLRLIRLEAEITRMYLGLYHIFNKLEEPKLWVDIMMAKFGWQSDELAAEFFAVIHMAAGSLALGFALPKITPAQTTVKHMSMLNTNRMNNNRMSGLNALSASANGHAVGGNQFFSGSRIGSPMASRANSFIEDPRLELEELLTHDGQLCLVGIMLVHAIYERIDEIMLVVKGLVGEEYDLDDRTILFDAI